MDERNMVFRCELVWVNRNVCKMEFSREINRVKTMLISKVWKTIHHQWAEMAKDVTTPSNSVDINITSSRVTHPYSP
jgi:hypothetical protein